MVFSSVTFPTTGKNNTNQSSEEYKNDIAQLKHDAKNASSNIDILRRDQINYKIEKDLLKEAYSVNLQSINFIITIVLGVFGLIVALLGYIGVKNVKNIKDDYMKELDRLRDMRIRFETDLLSMKDKQQEFESKVQDLDKTNKEQNNRLKVLELIEKISALINSKQWSWALHWISFGLDLDQKNIILLKYKAACHGKLGEFTPALNTNRLILEIEPLNTEVIANSLEFFALSNQSKEFEVIYKQHKDIVDIFSEGYAIIYLKVLLALIGGELKDTVNMLLQFAEKFPNTAKQFLGPTWSFDEAMIVISKLPEGKQKSLLIEMIRFFQGVINSNDFVVFLNVFKAKI